MNDGFSVRNVKYSSHSRNVAEATQELSLSSASASLPLGFVRMLIVQELGSPLAVLQKHL